MLAIVVSLQGSGSKQEGSLTLTQESTIPPKVLHLTSPSNLRHHNIISNDTIDIEVEEKGSGSAQVRPASLQDGSYPTCRPDTKYRTGFCFLYSLFQEFDHFFKLVNVIDFKKIHQTNSLMSNKTSNFP